jgi:methylthioribulose-1-phosphate dehydratase
MTVELNEVECAAAVDSLAEAGRDFYRRGWVLGTSGNFSAIISGDQSRMIITRSGVSKGSLSEDDFVIVDQTGAVTRGNEKPSAEIALHLAIVRRTGARAIFHTHSIAATVLSRRHAPAGGIDISGYEMLKGLSGIDTHLDREWLPIIENSQDYPALSREADAALSGHPRSHGFLLKGHGLYTWGLNVAEARRHVEILEFLMEVLTRWQS